MAICLRRFVKRSGSVIFTASKNQQANYSGHKVSSAAVPSVTSFDFSPSPSSFGYKLKARDVETNSPVFTTISNHEKDVREFFCDGNQKLVCLPMKGDSLRSVDFGFYTKQCEAFKEDDQKNMNNPGKAEPDQVLNVYNVLSSDLPKVFHSPMNYAIYHKNLVFENNIRGTTTIGLMDYVKQVALLKTVGYIKFANVKLTILKITAHPEDGTVRVRWRIQGVPNLRVLTSLFTLLSSFTKGGEKKDDLEGWYDGFSVFYVRSDGLVHKHTVDKMIPDSEEKVQNLKTNLAAKIALALGVGMKELSLLPAYENLLCKSQVVSDPLYPLYESKYFIDESKFQNSSVCCNKSCK